MAITIEYKDVENKLLLMFLINMMDMPMSRSQITDFIIDKDLMNHFVLEENLTDMVARGYLETSKEDAVDVNVTHYALTADGHTTLEFFENQIPRPVRNMIVQYVEEKRGQIKKGFEKSAHYFPQLETDDYMVKLAVYDDKRDTTLMHVEVPVVTREQAKHLQSNWNANYKTLYQKILTVLTE
jgi:DNA-binding PadR family transcriptional regulator